MDSLDIIQHIIDVSHPWDRILLMKLNKTWNNQVRIKTKYVSLEESIKNLDLLSIPKSRRKFMIPRLLHRACFTGTHYKEIIKYMKSINVRDWTLGLMGACEAQNIDLLIWLLNKFVRIRWSINYIQKLNFQPLFETACYLGNEKILDILFDKLNLVHSRKNFLYYQVDININWNNVFMKACQGGYLPLIIRISSLPPLSLSDLGYGLAGAYLGGNMELVQFFEILAIQYDKGLCLNYAIQSNNINVIKHIFTVLGPELSTFTVFSSDLEGLDKDLIDYIKSKIRIYEHGDFIKFKICCEVGDLDQVMKYYDILIKKCSPYMINYIGINCGCMYKQYEVLNFFIEKSDTFQCICNKSIKHHLKIINYRL